MTWIGIKCLASPNVVSLFEGYTNPGQSVNALQTGIQICNSQY